MLSVGRPGGLSFWFTGVRTLTARPVRDIPRVRCSVRWVCGIHQVVATSGSVFGVFYVAKIVDVVKIVDVAGGVVAVIDGVSLGSGGGGRVGLSSSVMSSPKRPARSSRMYPMVSFQSLISMM